jgi:hypothetical protein
MAKQTSPKAIALPRYQLVRSSTRIVCIIGFIARHSPAPTKTPRHLRTTGFLNRSIDSVLPAAAAATAATTTATTATRTTAAAAAATLTFLSFIDTQRTTAHVFAVQGLNSTLRIGARHLHEAEATRTARFAIVDQRDGLDCSVLLEQLPHLSFIRRERQVTHINLRHTVTVSL